MLNQDKFFDFFLRLEFSHCRSPKELVGGLAVVGETEYIHLHHHFVLNSLLDNLADNPNALARFQRELEIASDRYPTMKCAGHHFAQMTRKAFMGVEDLDGGEPWNSHFLRKSTNSSCASLSSGTNCY
jgi:hypothetical protein